MSLNSYKIILLGESSVGKTSIITRLTKDKFEEVTVSTLNEYCCEKDIDVKGTPMKFQIWDTAGQERYRSLTKNFFTGATAAILVYDITNKDSFEKLKNYWHKEINQYSHNISIFIIIYNIYF